LGNRRTSRPKDAAGRAQTAKAGQPVTIRGGAPVPQSKRAPAPSIRGGGGRGERGGTSSLGKGEGYRSPLKGKKNPLDASSPLDKNA